MKYWANSAILILLLRCLALVSATPEDPTMETMSKLVVIGAADTRTTSHQSRQPRAEGTDATNPKFCALSKIKSKETLCEDCFGKDLANCPKLNDTCYNKTMFDSTVCDRFSGFSGFSAVAKSSAATKSAAQTSLAGVGLAVLALVIV